VNSNITEFVNSFSLFFVVGVKRRSRREEPPAPGGWGNSRSGEVGG